MVHHDLALFVHQNRYECIQRAPLSCWIAQRTVAVPCSMRESSARGSGT